MTLAIHQYTSKVPKKLAAALCRAEQQLTKIHIIYGDPRSGVLDVWACRFNIGFIFWKDNNPKIRNETSLPGGLTSVSYAPIDYRSVLCVRHAKTLEELYVHPNYVPPLGICLSTTDGGSGRLYFRFPGNGIIGDFSHDFPSRTEAADWCVRNFFGFKIKVDSGN